LVGEGVVFDGPVQVQPTFLSLLSVGQALCYLSVCVLPDHAIPVMLDITKRISMSHSYKTKMSMLEYVQVNQSPDSVPLYF
jgi:hypothetical protein